jgi:hypothetical protein
MLYDCCGCRDLWQVLILAKLISTQKKKKIQTTLAAIQIRQFFVDIVGICKKTYQTSARACKRVRVVVV